MTEWPACTNKYCGYDTYGPYHGDECARTRHLRELMEAWQ